MMRILLLEDDALFAQSLQEFLEEQGYEITHAKSAEELLDETFAEKFDLYILDINIPGSSGLELLGQLREAEDETPAMFLTSYNDRQTLHEGFKSGADDYLKKPVDLDELVLRIEALLKRSGKRHRSYRFSNGVSYDLEHDRVLQDDRDLKLAAKVVELLKLFIEHERQVVTKEMMQDRLWVDEEFSEGSLRVYINKLKKILPENSIVNIKGVGYKLEP